MSALGRQEQPKQVHNVFGVSNDVLIDSYVDRGDLDAELKRLLQRRTHVALRGVSKSGKSWLRQTIVPDAIVVQCRLGKTVTDLYREALGELGIRLQLSSTQQTTLTGTVEASGEVGIGILAKLRGKAGFAAGRVESTATAPISEAVTDLRQIAQIILASGRRLVIEDFHYLSVEERKKFAFDLKALWDFGVFVVIVGVWNRQNMLLYLNPDLTLRVYELGVEWDRSDLQSILDKGGAALNIAFGDALRRRAIDDCYENAGILQALVLLTLDSAGIRERQGASVIVGDLGLLEEAEMMFADQLNPLYQQFADLVSRGIRVRRNATGIYAHAMAVILSASDADLMRGLSLDRIYQEANRREPRIQKGNLRTVLERIESLQVDEDGRGLILAYNEATGTVSVVDRQILLYRKCATVKWPWEQLIEEAESQGDLFVVD